MRQGRTNHIPMRDHCHDALRIRVPHPLNDPYAPLLYLKQTFTIGKSRVDRIMKHLVCYGLGAHFVERFTFPVSIAYLMQIGDFLERFL